MNLSEHPGYMGGIDGIIAHHANWPAYPFEGSHGLLFRFAAFAPGVRFVVVDEVDRAVLFVADVECAKLQTPMLPVNFHVAGWHVDLLKLQAEGLISGIKTVSETRWKTLQWQRLHAELNAQYKAKHGGKIAPSGVNLAVVVDGKIIPIGAPQPKKDAEDDDEVPLLSWPEFIDDQMVVTEAGREWVHEKLIKDWSEWEEHLSPRVLKLLGLGFHDTCVREACVELECHLKKNLGSKSYGDKLVEAYLENLALQNRFLESYRRTIRQDLRAVFKLIRNRYMHIMVDLDRAGALVNLIRIARINSLLIGGKGPSAARG